MIRWALKLSEFNIEWEHRPGVQNVFADVLSRNPVSNLDGSQISCAALRALALNSREQLIREQREDPENGKKLTVNVDQVRVYRPRQSDTISSDSHVETLYEGQKSRDRSSRSQSGKFKRSRKTSSEQNNGHKSSPSHQQDSRQDKSPTVASRHEGSGQYNKARVTKTTKDGTNWAAERRTVRPKHTTAVRPCPYYLHSRVRQPEGFPEERRNSGLASIPQNNIRRRSLSIEDLDGDPVDRSE
ncbi:uncharacterized protein TNCV_2690831 [Trichonephila clavipes]|uniref:Uncharacterized protein n=1 Tax=Trichonephila clavipes TaxID=2585209 RepID=A0A8X6VYG7_TRICX|nr:uncharacterized protein TNCV_2690831 [Trichonephila clavipes]